jgi:hypothetical protein
VALAFTVVAMEFVVTTIYFAVDPGQLLRVDPHTSVVPKIPSAVVQTHVAQRGPPIVTDLAIANNRYITEAVGIPSGLESQN